MNHRHGCSRKEGTCGPIEVLGRVRLVLQLSSELINLPSQDRWLPSTVDQLFEGVPQFLPESS